MNLYEFTNFSDVITFYAPDDDIAFAVSMLVGNGHCGCVRVTESGNVEVKDAMPYLFTKIPDEVMDRLRGIVDSRCADVARAARTFACCKPGDREIFDEYTENGTNAERYAKWDDKHRTSLTDYCKFARMFKLKDEKKGGAK